MLDTQSPVTTVTEGGPAFAGGLFNRLLAPEISFSDTTYLGGESI